MSVGEILKFDPDSNELRSIHTGPKPDKFKRLQGEAFLGHALYQKSTPKPKTFGKKFCRKYIF